MKPVVLGASPPVLRLILGAGYVGARVAELAVARGEAALCIVRKPERAAELASKGARVECTGALEAAKAHVRAGVHVLVCFPPDGHTDAALAPLLASASSVSYVSSTSVYDAHAGVVNDFTPAASAPSARLDAEAAYRAVGATVLRAPGIYGPDRGLHVRVQRGLHQMPGAGDNHVSRIHVDDLAALLLASHKVRGQTYVVGDAEPVRQRDVVAWICEAYGCAPPPSVPAESVHPTLRVNRLVDGSRALLDLGVQLKFPSYREGMRRAGASGAPVP